MAVINTNITSLIGQQNLNKSASSLQTAMERLSSGSRINSAKDDAAGQAIANRMSSQITGLSQAQRNANDGISLAQTTEGALNQVNDNLQRIRELTVQATNGTNSQDDLNSIQNEINQRLDEINRISDETGFNGTKVLQSDSGLKIQVGANDGEAITINLKEINAETLGLTGFNVNGKGEVDNTAATKDDLTLGGFESQGVTNGVERFTNELQNTAATASDVLGSVSDGAEITYSGKNTGMGSAATVTGGTYTYDANSDSYSFDAQDAAFSDVAKRLIPSEAGATNTMTINIEDGSGGGTQDVVVDSDGNLSSADTGDALYLTADGNLSQTNTDGSGGTLARATVDSVLESMGAQSVSAPSAPTSNVVTGANATNTVTFGALTEGQSVTINDLTFTAGKGGATNTEVANAFSTYLNNNDATVSQGEFTGDATGFNGLTNITVSSNSNDLVFTASGGTGDETVLDAASVGDSTTATITTDGQAAGTGGSITFNGTTYSADTANGAIDVKDATISADKLAKQMEGSTFTVNDGGNEFAVDANGNVDRNLQALQITTDYGDGTDAASLDVEFGNMKAGDAYTLDGVTFTASQDVTAEQVANAFATAIKDGDFDSGLGDFGASPSFNTMDTSSDYTTSVDKGTLTITTTSSSDGSGTSAFDTGGSDVATTGSATVNTNTTDVYSNADGALVTEASSTIERFVQEDGTVTDGSARQVFVGQEGELTFDAVTESERSENPLGQLDDALSQVDSLRSDLGAIQNRFDSAITNLSTTETNLSAARSRIEDADYATEVANMTKNQILQQAGTSVLAQANQLPQSVLSLLG
ncbi:flagellin [Salinicola sp. MIT1003]|uniref:flagellin N-terminal helical domain-containing protein n=1 Tax=Salinicola sp. MIT1003 TaxID=1882734 RepID=UPI0008DC8FA7|nr:flagellin [Salinicola sp. MIT1003]OHZ04583.1 hypothetical protein BC443_01710 [Salinicola sp. MIT1003]